MLPPRGNPLKNSSVGVLGARATIEKPGARCGGGDLSRIFDGRPGRARVPRLDGLYVGPRRPRGERGKKRQKEGGSGEGTRKGELAKS